MSSTTSSRSQRGQALALFIISLTTLLLAGAMALDGGLIFLERRDQQNAADAAAIAGARYLVTDLPAARADARTAAVAIASANGFQQGVDSATVEVYTPPRSAATVLAAPIHRGPGHIEVRIGSTRPSILASLAGIANWNISARAVAVNGEGALGDFAILALDPNDCNSLVVTGTGSATAHGNIQVDSDCPTGAMTSGGGGTITVDITVNADYRCNVVGGVNTNGGGTINCNVVHPDQPHGDPLEAWPIPYENSGLTPPVALALPPLHVDPVDLLADATGPVIPDGCPGASKKPMTWATPQNCEFKGNTYRDTSWVLYPGSYPGGLDLSDGSFYFMPGIYYVAGGGIDIGGGGATARTLLADGTLVTGVDPSDATTLPAANETYGVMFYNTDHPDEAWDSISMNGGYADFELLPLHFPEADYESTWNGFLIFNDRDFPTSPTASSVTLNGGGSNFAALGLIYTPSGLVTVNGNSDTDGDGNPIEFDVDQFIAWNYKLNGNGGSIEAWNDTDRLPQVRAAGLVE